MPRKELLDYIEKCRTRGLGKERIAAILLEYGWPEKEIRKAFGRLKDTGSPKKIKTRAIVTRKIAPVRPQKATVPQRKPSPVKPSVKKRPAPTQQRPDIKTKGKAAPPVSGSVSEKTGQKSFDFKERGVRSVTKPYAGLWYRFVAFFIDWTLIALIVASVFPVVAYAGKGFGGFHQVTVFIVTGSFLAFVYLLYFPIMESSGPQAGIGKRLTGIRVSCERKEHVSFVRAFLRNLMRVLSAFLLGAGFFMAGFTAKRQTLHDMITGCVVLRYKAVRGLRVILLFVLCLTALFAGWTLLEEPIRQEVFREGLGSDAPLIPASIPADGKKEPEPVHLSESEYDDLLHSGETRFESGDGMSLGPIALKLSKFWDRKDNPSLWIEVRMIPLPNFNLNAKLARIVIDHVWDFSGKDIYNPDSKFETPLFEVIPFVERLRPKPHLAAFRNVYLKPGVKSGDIDRIEGRVILSLPVGIRMAQWEKNATEIRFKMGKSIITPMQSPDNEVSYGFRGPFENCIATYGYDSEGSRIENAGYSYSHSGDKKVLCRFLFKEKIHSVAVALASRIELREFRFSIKKDR